MATLCASVGRVNGKFIKDIAERARMEIRVRTMCITPLSCKEHTKSRKNVFLTVEFDLTVEWACSRQN